MIPPDKTIRAAALAASLLAVGYLAVLTAGSWSDPEMPWVSVALSATVPRAATTDQQEEIQSPTP